MVLPLGNTESINTFFSEVQTTTVDMSDKVAEYKVLLQKPEVQQSILQLDGGIQFISVDE